MPEPQYYPDTAPMPEIYPQVAPQVGYNENSQQDSGVSDTLKNLMSRSGGQQSEGLAALIAKALASGGGGGSLEEQRRLMSLLEMLKGR